MGLIMACGLANLAIRQRYVTPPQMHVRLGELHLVALTVPEVADPPLMSCHSYPSACAPRRTYDAYTLWFIDGRQLPRDPNTAFRLLITLPLKDPYR